jgi:WD40 repeat protein
MLSFRPAWPLHTAALALLFAPLSQGQSAGQPGPAAAPAPPPGDGRLPRGAVARLGPVHYPRPQQVRCVAFSADNRLVAFSPDAVTVVLREVRTGGELRRIAVPDEWVKVLAFAPDGKTLAVGSRQVRLWDVATGKEVRHFGASAHLLKALAFAPDGKTLAADGADAALRRWDVATGKELPALGGRESNVYAVAFSPDGKLLAAASWDQAVRLWDVATGKPRGVCKGHAHWPLALAFSPDGKLLVSGDRGGAVRLWDVATAREARSFAGHTDSVLAVAFAPDGRSLVSAGKDGTVRVWDAATGKERARVGAQARGLGGLSVGREGTLTVIDQAGEVEVWAWRPGGEIRQVAGGTYEAVFAVEFTPDGKSVVTVDKHGTTRVWDAASAKEVGAFKAEPVPLALSAGGRVLAAQDKAGRVVLRGAATGKRLGAVQRASGQGGWALRPDGRALASASWADREVSVWNAADGRRLHRFPGAAGWRAGPLGGGLGALGGGLGVGGGALGALGGTPGGPLQGSLCSLTYSADGRSLAVGWEHAVRVWRLDTGLSLRPFEREPAEDEGLRGGAVAFSPDGRTLATVGLDGAIRLWEVSTGRLRWRTAHEATRVFCPALRFSPDGRVLAVPTGRPRNCAHVFDLATGQEGKTPGGHAGELTCLAFSPDGTRLASGSEDASVLLWDVRKLLGPAPPAPAAPTAADLDAWWRDLASADGRRAYKAVWRLAAAPAQSVPLLRERLRPAAPVDGKRVERLIADLDADEFAAREAASRELEALGQRAESALRRALARPESFEAKRRAERLLGPLEAGRQAAEHLRELLALEVLETAATPEARELLRALAKGAPDAALTLEAAAALGRLGRRSGAPHR